MSVHVYRGGGGKKNRSNGSLTPISPLKKFWQMWYHFLHPWPLSFKPINISPMQIHIHKDGKTFGPYPIEQVRQLPSPFWAVIFFSISWPSPEEALGIGGMKVFLFSFFVALLMVGCVRDRMIDYYENGQKKWERSYKDRQLIGPVTWWYESGKKKKELHHKYGGKMHGPATWWYENGQKMLEKNYKDGKLDGLFIAWNEKGKEIKRKKYKEGELVRD